MILKILFVLIALLNGGWMIFDGLHVILKGKYFGPPQPGSWSKIFTKVGINPFSLGPLFIILGLFWFLAAFGIFQDTDWGWIFAVCVSIGSLWYVSIGTILSIIALAVLFLI